MARLKDTRTWITCLAALVVLGGLVRLALDDRPVALAVEEPAPPEAEPETPPPGELAHHAAASLEAADPR